MAAVVAEEAEVDAVVAEALVSSFVCLNRFSHQMSMSMHTEPYKQIEKMYRT